MYFTKEIPSHPKDIRQFFDTWTATHKLMFAALMAAIATVLQSAGGMFPGVSFLISLLTTAPILIGSLISFRLGAMIYMLTTFLLLIIQPSELIFFPFTTGLLGLFLGWTLLLFNRRIEIIVSSGTLLFLGMCIPLYLFAFPVFGPTILSSFNMTVLAFIFSFSLLYCWLWLEIGLLLLRNIKNFLL
ncbi:hypothetical protein [Sporosarcina sp. G11-34]|uniref:hypothetical protein n=1 Tax=Sporosarcina sp. G11-34 TaxID=2849605 RepID=UPI0022A9127F|nr:hypothetical protein [Sporosarcina sp. G11-34]MCZ2257197.1 hypothetical protein [Sporosarcina sp. G11-34]